MKNKNFLILEIGTLWLSSPPPINKQLQNFWIRKFLLSLVHIGPVVSEEKMCM